MSCVPTTTNFILDNEALTFSEMTFDAIKIRTVVPDGWVPLDATTFVNPRGDTYLVITAFPGGDVEATIKEFASAAGLPPLTKFIELPIKDQMWELYTVTDAGRGTLVAITVRRDTTYVDRKSTR